MLNVFGIFYGIGALCIPLFYCNHHRPFPIVPQLFFAPPCSGMRAVFLALSFPQPRGVQKFSRRDAAQVARYPGVLVLGFLLLFCESGRRSQHRRLDVHLRRVAGPVPDGHLILAGYWATLMAGRLVAARLLKSISKNASCLLSGIGALLGAATSARKPVRSHVELGSTGYRIFLCRIFPDCPCHWRRCYRKWSALYSGIDFGIALVGGYVVPVGR